MHAHEAPDTPAKLERHPDDDWVRADPWPIGVGSGLALDGIIAALCPSADDGAPTSPALLGAVRRQLLATLPYMSPLAARGLMLLVHLLDWSPMWRLRASSRLHRLPQPRGAALLAELAASRFAPFATMVVAMRAAVLTAYFDQPEVHAAIGYDPVGFMRRRIAVRGAIVGASEVASDGASDVVSQGATLEPSEATLLAAADARAGAGAQP